jgi:hypothetical protein
MSEQLIGVREKLRRAIFPFDADYIPFRVQNQTVDNVRRPVNRVMQGQVRLQIRECLKNE